MKLVLVPNNMKSAAAKRLAGSLSAKLGYKVLRVRPERVRRRRAFVLHKGTDKLTQFRRFHEHGVSAPEFTTDRSVAIGWLPDSAVVCRTLLRGSEGRGIVMAETEEQVVAAPLYTKYIKKKKEFRVHVLGGKVIDVQEKRKRKDLNNERDHRIRNVANGYVFCRTGVHEPEGLRDLAVGAVRSLGSALGSDSLGAVDIGYNEHSNLLFVLEVNATPGMEGTTLDNYSNAIAAWWKEL